MRELLLRPFVVAHALGEVQVVGVHLPGGDGVEDLLHLRTAPRGQARRQVDRCAGAVLAEDHPVHVAHHGLARALRRPAGSLDRGHSPDQRPDLGVPQLGALGQLRDQCVLRVADELLVGLAAPPGVAVHVGLRRLPRCEHVELRVPVQVQHSRHDHAVGLDRPHASWLALRDGGDRAFLDADPALADPFRGDHLASQGDGLSCHGPRRPLDSCPLEGVRHPLQIGLVEGVPRAFPGHARGPAGLRVHDQAPRHAPRERLVAVEPEAGHRQVARRLVERDRLRLAGPGLEHHHLGAGGSGGVLEVGQHRPGQSAALGARYDVHPLDLGGLAGAAHLHVRTTAPGTRGHREVVEVADEERPHRLVEVRRLDGRLVAPAVAAYVLLLHLLDEEGRIGMGDRHPLHPPPGDVHHG